MKMNIEIDMTPEEARKFLGLPDVAKVQEKMMRELENRMKAAIDVNDPEAMLKAWLPLGGQGFEQLPKPCLLASQKLIAAFERRE